MTIDDLIPAGPFTIEDDQGGTFQVSDIGQARRDVERLVASLIDVTADTDPKRFAGVKLRELHARKFSDAYTTWAAETALAVAASRMLHSSAPENIPTQMGSAFTMILAWRTTRPVGYDPDFADTARPNTTTEGN